MDLMLGIDDFGKVIRNRIAFVDKTLFIKDIIDTQSVDVPVIIRPRRFGKTFNLSMLHHFFAAKVNGQPTQGLFEGLKISRAGDQYMQQQGQYPVVSLSFKSIKESRFEDAYAQMIFVISEAYSEHDYLRDSHVLADYEKETIRRILIKDNIDSVLLKNALYSLTHYLYRHHGVKPWLLIDEYDTPIQSAYLNHYYQPMIELMRGVFGKALKGNTNIHRAVITGILRIAKENLFSGVNNLDVYSVLNTEYSEYFGFTEAEVDEVLRQASLSHQAKAIKDWYNGYQIGDHQKGCHQIYNPWSIAKCVNRKGALQPYWVNTSDNALIKTLMNKADENIKTDFELLLTGQKIKALVDENMVLSFLEKQEAIWSLLLFSGYLTCTEMELEFTKYQCQLCVPNQEVAALYKDIIKEWFMDTVGLRAYQTLLTSLVEGRLDDVLPILKKFLLESASYFDVKGSEPEKFYHGFVMGLIVGLSTTHTIQSNRESGYGRYDVMIIPKDPKKLGIILEFKVAAPNITLPEAAQQALTQLQDRHYETTLQQKGIQNILQIGLGFRGKEVELIAERLTKNTRHPAT